MLKRFAYWAARRIRPDFIRRYEIGKFAEGHIVPQNIQGPVEDPFQEGSIRPCSGIDLNPQEQVALLEEFADFHALFTMIRTDPRINPQYHTSGDRIRNGYYPTPDAETYAAIIARTRPPRIVEVGGGYSTLIARAVIDRLQLATELVVVDPAPRTDVRLAAHRLITARVENYCLAGMALPPSSILFIDSSHVLRAGGDVAYLYDEVIPNLAVGVRVHVHDIFLPFDYSASALRAWWTEQYVLEALLSHSPRYHIELTLRWLTRTAPELMARVFGPVVTENPAHGGGSVWFRITDGYPEQSVRPEDRSFQHIQQVQPPHGPMQ